MITLGIYGPKSPEASGVAEYIDVSLRHLPAGIQGTHVSNQDGTDPSAFDLALYHLGNNRFHHCAFRSLAMRPGPVLLHEYNNVDYYLSCWALLSDAIQRRVLDLLGTALKVRLDSIDGLTAIQHANPQLDVCAIDMHIESLLLEHATQVFVHNEHTLNKLRGRYPSKVFVHIPFPVSRVSAASATRARRVIGVRDSDYLFGTFGYIGHYKRLECIIEAWCRWLDRPSNVKLVIVGERQYQIGVPKDEGILELGYVDSHEFDALITGVDCGIQLRYPCLGETSGPISKLIAHGRPVILSKIPEMDVYGHRPSVMMVPVGEGEVNEILKAFQCLHRTGKTTPKYDESFSWRAWTSTIAPYLDPSVSQGT